MILPEFWEKQKSSSGKTYYENVPLGVTQWESPNEQFPQFLDLPYGWVAKISRSGQIYYVNARLRIAQWEKPTIEYSCNKMRGLKWVGNSCYLDSSLVCLFIQPCDFTDYIINVPLKVKTPEEKFVCGNDSESDLVNRKSVQDKLRLLVESMRGVTEKPIETCSDLRAVLKNCPDSESYYDERPKDAGEFLTYLLSLFPVNLAHKKFITYGTNNIDEYVDETDLVLTSEIIDREANVFQFVSAERLQSYHDGVKLSTFLNLVEDSGDLGEDNLFKANGQTFRRRILIQSIDYTPYLIFNIKRTGLVFDEEQNVVEKFFDTMIIPEEEIELENGQYFELSGVVIHTGGAHYICIVKCDNLWYHYDDIRSDKMKLRGTFDDAVKKSRHNPLTHGTLYFYSPIYPQ